MSKHHSCLTTDDHALACNVDELNDILSLSTSPASTLSMPRPHPSNQGLPLTCVLLLAGNTLAFTIWNLAQCPDKAAKLCAEIDAAPGTATFESIDHLPYMDAVLRESLACFHPSLWL